MPKGLADVVENSRRPGGGQHLPKGGHALRPRMTRNKAGSRRFAIRTSFGPPGFVNVRDLILTGDPRFRSIDGTAWHPERLTFENATPPA